MTGTGSRAAGMGRTAARIRSARLAAKMSQEALARALGVSVNNIQVIERGERLPSLATAIRLERVLGRPMGEVIDFEEVVATTTSTNAKRGIRQLDEPQPRIRRKQP